ncbi:unnamed protein product [Ilex paraguariensis]|uniref:Uncharacterized protein n=1 Tax=Ilex paraguariensis TaxID=185542 RepID=A0ABC8REE7_9AQUA
MEQSSSEQSQSQNPVPEECLKLLKGERDEQKLAGLFLVTKFFNKDDNTSFSTVYDAVGPRFLDRLLRTGNSVFLNHYVLFSLLLSK